MRELFPVPRSLTGDGVRETLRVLAREVPLELVETPTGTPIFDWVAPREWTLRDAWIEGPGGKRVVDAADSPLHVLGYSTPVDAVLSLEELRSHVFTHEDPDLVPYRTSYWTEQWGFCMSRRRLESLEPGDYHVLVDAELVDGFLTSGELTLEGARESEFLLSTYVCHPALANDNLSGIVVLWALARTLARQRLEHTYRLLWSPGTLGPLCWLARNLDTLDRVQNGLVISCVGDPGPAAVQAEPARRHACRPRRRVRPRARAGKHRRRLAADRRRRAAVLLAWLRPARGDALADAARALPRVPLLRGRSHPRAARGPRGLLPGRTRDHRRRGDERELPEPVSVRRAAARPARPLSERPRRHEPGARLPLAAEPLRRRARLAHDRRAVRTAVRGRSRGRRQARIRIGLLERDVAQT